MAARRRIGIGGACIVAATLGVLTGAAARPTAASSGDRFRPQAGRYYLTDAELRRIRRNVETKPWARVAWARTRAAANAALQDAPAPAPSAGMDYSASGRDASGRCSGSVGGWYCLLYLRGLHDGEDAFELARAYAVGGGARYGLKAKEFLLAWARTYTQPNPTVAHDIAEPAGFMLKAFLAFDLVRGVFTSDERREFQDWAGLFVADGENRADHQRDAPGIPDQTFAGDRSNWQSYGNSEAFSRALAVTAAAVVGGPTLQDTLRWNWQHTTAAGLDNGWPQLIDGEIIDGTGGETFEGRARHDIGYGLLGTSALMLVAHIARHSGFEPNLFTYTTVHGNALLSPYLFYGPFLDGRTPWPRSDLAYGKRTLVASEHRAVLEWAAGDAGVRLSPALRRVLDAHGPRRRGADFDPRTGLYNALVAAR